MDERQTSTTTAGGWEVRPAVSASGQHPPPFLPLPLPLPLPLAFIASYLLSLLVFALQIG